MDTLSYRTKSLRKEDARQNWRIVDAEGAILGRLSSVVASVLRGKNKPEFTPHVDCGDHVIVINAEKVRLTGKKLTAKEHITYSGYPGGQKRMTIKEVLEKKPEVVIEHAVRGMLPKSRLGRAMFRKLYVYVGPEHPHQAQKPEPLNV